MSTARQKSSAVAVMAFLAGMTAALWLGGAAARHVERLRPPADSILAQVLQRPTGGSLLPDGTQLPPTPHVVETVLRYCNGLAGAALSQNGLPVLDLSQLPTLVLSMGQHITIDQVTIGSAVHTVVGTAPQEQTALEFAQALVDSGRFDGLTLDGYDTTEGTYRFTLSYPVQP